MRFASESITDDRESRVCHIRVHNNTQTLSNTHTHMHMNVYLDATQWCRSLSDFWLNF